MLLFLESFEVPCVVRLRIDCHVHLNEAVVTAGRILVIIELVFTHVTATHTAVLSNEPLLELLEKAVVSHFESLN